MPPAQPKKIGLCLSGGGFRATFFHLGLIRFLNRHGLLSQVTHISSVSGGSILAAHLVLNWERYLANFEATEKELIKFGQRDIRGRIIRRWLFAIVFPVLRFLPRVSHRTYLLEKEYSYLLNRALLSDLTPPQKNRPALHLLATSFTTGKLCSFSSEGFWTHDKSSAELYRTGLMPLALAVASSSAFPPIFPPTAITRKMLDASNEELPYDPEFLTDGGVFDNLGYAKFLQLIQSGDCNIDYLILSDAGAQLDWDIKGRFTRVISRTIRSTDILMQRVANFTISDLESNLADTKTFHLSISDQILPSASKSPLLIDFQKKLPRIRTDLNRFSALEIDFLARHGEEVARNHLDCLIDPNKDAGPIPDKSTSQMTASAKSKVARQLDNSRLRKVGLFDKRDWASFALYGYLLAVLAIATFPYVYVAQRAVDGDLFARRVEVSFATDRMPDSAAQFTDELEDKLYTGLAIVNVPSNHRLGVLEQPGGGLFDFTTNPERYFALSSINTHTALTVPSAEAATTGVIIYVHGYNTTFSYSLLKTAQLAWDIQFRGAAVGYAWPSQGKFSAYLQDQQAAISAIPHFVEYISSLKRAQPGPIDIVAEGMGAAILLEGIKRYVESIDTLAVQKSEKSFGQLIFLVPDVDSAQFANLLKITATAAERVTVFVAPKSEEMRAAKLLAGSTRAGSIATYFASIPNVDTVVLGGPSAQPATDMVDAVAAIVRRQPIPWSPSLKRRDDKVWEMTTRPMSLK